jgi:CheY-like chemotaxis protein
MSNLIVLMSDEAGENDRLCLALTRTAPQCQVAFAGSRDEIKALRTPALILLDLMLSGESAFDVLRWLRSEQRYRDIPIFVLGSPVMDTGVNEAYALGANSCLLKGPEPEAVDTLAQSIATYASLMPHVHFMSCN